MRTFRSVNWAAAAVIVLASCGGTSVPRDAGGPDPSPAAQDVAGDTADIRSATVSFSERLDAIDEAVAIWRSATSLAAAHAAAETALNLVVGPNGPGYGDRDGDGVIAGDTSAGLLPGLDGTPGGLAIPLSANECVSRDVLGGTWAEPDEEWEGMLSAIDHWRIDNNTMPTLASHPMRVVGWATFTLGSDSLDDAHVYAGHARLHVDITRRALEC